MSKTNTETIVMELHPREAALIRLIRTVGNGTLDKVGIKHGLPAVVVALSQRVNFESDLEVDAVLGMPVVPVPLGHGERGESSGGGERVAGDGGEGSSGDSDESAPADGT